MAFVCQKFCFNKEDAEEALQDTFYIAYTKAGELRSETILAYLRKIAIHECYRKRYNGKEIVLSNTYAIDIHEESDIDFLPEAYLNEKEQRAELLRIIMALPKMQWETIYLYYYASFKTEEIAQLHKCSTSNVRKTLRNARAAIKDHLEGKRKKSASKGVLLASAGALSMAAFFLAEEQAFAAVFVPTAVPCWAGASAAVASSTIAATTTVATTAATGYIAAACVATFVAVSAITYITLWPDADPTPTPEPYIIYEQTAPPTTMPSTTLMWTTPAPSTPASTTPVATTAEPTIPETSPPTLPPTPPPTPAPTPAPTQAPEPPPVQDRSLQILAALGAAATLNDVAQIIQMYGFQFERVIRIDGEELRFYVTNEGSGDILIGTATNMDDHAARFDFMFFNNGYMPSASIDLILFMEGGG